MPELVAYAGGSTQKFAADTVCSLAGITPAGRVDQIDSCRKRASPQPAGEGLGVGVAVGEDMSRNNNVTSSPLTTQVGLARLAYDRSRPGQAGACDGEQSVGTPTRRQPC